MARILVATLADAVEAGPGHKFSVLGGGVDVFQTGQFPVTMTRLALLFAVEMAAGETGETKVLVVFKGSDDKEFMRVEVGLAARIADAPAAVVWAGTNLPPITTKIAGRISIEASVGESSYHFGLAVRGPATPLFPTPTGSMAN